jgi:hypothetical protein
MTPELSGKFTDVNTITDGFAELGYICSKSIATALYIAGNLGNRYLSKVRQA